MENQRNSSIEIPVYILTLDWASGKEHGTGVSAYSSFEDALQVYNEKLEKARNEGPISNWKAKDTYEEEETIYSNERFFEGYLLEDYELNHYQLSIMLQRLALNAETVKAICESRDRVEHGTELQRGDIQIDCDMEVVDGGTAISAYVETWFDTYKKFGIPKDEGADGFINIYAVYYPFSDDLKVVGIVVANGQPDRNFHYIPTENEAALIKSLITDKVRQVEGVTPQEFCEQWR